MLYHGYNIYSKYPDDNGLKCEGCETHCMDKLKCWCNSGSPEYGKQPKCKGCTPWFGYCSHATSKPWITQISHWTSSSHWLCLQLHFLHYNPQCLSHWHININSNNNIQVTPDSQHRNRVAIADIHNPENRIALHVGGIVYGIVWIYLWILGITKYCITKATKTAHQAIGTYKWSIDFEMAQWCLAAMQQVKYSAHHQKKFLIALHTEGISSLVWCIMLYRGVR